MIDYILNRPEPIDMRSIPKLVHNYRGRLHVIQSYREKDYSTFSSIEQARAVLNGHRFVAVEATSKATRLPDVDWTTDGRPLALITGSMNRGLPYKVLDACEEIVMVPQFDDVGFLAPTAALAIISHDVFMARCNPKRVFG